MDRATDSGEQKLIARAQVGDASALNRLLDGHAPALRRRIHGRLPPAVRRKCADSDIMQETMMVAARRIGEFEYRGPGSFRAWLAGIAENAARRAVQHYAGTQKRDVGAEVSRDARARTAQHRGPTPSPSTQVMGDEMKRRVAEALAEMPEDYCVVIQLLQHRRLTIAEVAELMDRSPNAVKKLHARALADLAARLGVQGRKRDA